MNKAFNQKIIDTFGQHGRQWLDELHNILNHCTAIYELTNITPLLSLSFNYVATAKKGNESIIIKLGIPGDETNNEIDALQAMQSNGMVKLLNFDKSRGIILLEQCQPGNTLANLEDDFKATQIASHIIKTIHTPKKIEDNFPTTKDWFKRLDDTIHLPDTFSLSHIDRAQKIAYELHQDLKMPVLLHGDLHHFNILSAGSEWLAIDPKGIIGPPEYECGAFLRNPIPNIATHTSLNKILSRRIDVFAESLSFDKEIITAWAYAQAVLASVWALDSHSSDWQLFLTCAEALNT